MRVYEAADGRWILWTGVEKIFFDTETEAKTAMAEMTKEGQYIEDVRQFARDYRLMMERAHSLTDTDLESAYITASQLAAYVTMAQQLANFRDSAAVAQADYGTTLNQVRAL